MKKQSGMNLAKKKGIDRKELIKTIGSEFPKGKGVEVGTFKGHFSKDIMQVWEGTLYMVDAWPAQEASNHKNLERDSVYGQAIDSISEYEDRAIMIRARSEIAAGMFEDASLDFVYIDANHAYEYVAQDIRLWYTKVKPGGYLCGQDYLDIDWNSDPNFDRNGKDKHIYIGSQYFGAFGVNPAVDEFCENSGYEPIVTAEWRGSWLIKKKGMIESKRIGVLVMYDNHYERMAKVTIDQNIRQYCDLHKYTLIPVKIESPGNGRAPQWQKIIESIKILDKNELDWLFFLDLDCLIMNPSIKLESIIDENYSFIIPSHGVNAIDFPMEENEFGDNCVITSAFLVKNSKIGKSILNSIWECRGTPEGVNIDEFDHEQRQCRITLSNPEFRKHAKIVEERLLNRFWHVKSPYMALHTGINKLTWEPGDFIAHVTGYPLEERIQILGELNHFTGGHIGQLQYKRGSVHFSSIENLAFAKATITDLGGRCLYESEFQDMSNKTIYFISVPEENERVIFEAYDKSGKTIAKKLLIME